MCKDCGHSESLKDREIAECPSCKSTKIEVIPYSKTRRINLPSGGSKARGIKFSSLVLIVILGIICSLFLIFSSMIVNSGSNLLPLGATLLVIGTLILFILIGIVGKKLGYKGSCWNCCPTSC